MTDRGRRAQWPLVSTIGIRIVDETFELTSLQGKIVFYHRCNEDAPGTFIPELIVSGRHGARHAFELRGTGAMGSGLYCTLEEPFGRAHYRTTVDVSKVYYVNGIDEVLRLDEWNRECTKLMWDVVRPEGSDGFENAWPRGTVSAKMSTFFDVDETRSEAVLNAMIGAYSSDAKRLVVQPITFVLMALGYEALVYSGDAAHLNNDLAHGCIVFPTETIPTGLDAERAEVRTGARFDLIH